MKVIIIAAIGQKNELGKNNMLLWNLPDDTEHFHSQIEGQMLIIGRKSHESTDLNVPGITNIVVTSKKNFSVKNGLSVNNPEAALTYAKSKSVNKVYVLGGGEIYKRLITIAVQMIITHVEGSFPDADTFFPKINKNEWVIIKKEHHQKDPDHQYAFDFVFYNRIKA